MSFTWSEALAELERRRAKSRELGGPERVARQHAAGKHTIRERIDQICDDFREVGGLAAYPDFDSSGELADTLPSTYVCGLGRIDGRPVAIGGEDFTVRAGAPQLYLDRYKGGMGGFVEDLAYDYKIPLVMLNEGIGGDVASQDVKGHSYVVSSFSWKRCYDLLSEVPVLMAVVGPAAGGNAGRAVLSHFSVMSRGSVLFAGGPPVVQRALGIDINKEELGGIDVHTTVSGAVDNPADSESDAFDQIRKVLSYLPQNVWQMPPRGDRSDPVDRVSDELLKIIPENRRRAYSPKKMIEAIVDVGSFFEIGPGWGRAVTTGFARMDGIPIGVIASNPAVGGGALDGPAAEKQIRFVDMCSVFHLPILYFCDVPGFMVGPDAERGSVVRLGMRAIQSIIEAEVPIITIQVRKAYGLAVSATSNPDSLGLRLAWPTAEWGDMPIEGGVEAGFRREIEAADDPAAHRRMIEERLLANASPWKTVEAFGVEDMIDPRETRPYVAEFLNASLGMLASKLGPQRRQWTIRP